MGLPDFLQNKEFNDLRQQMGADLVSWDSGGSDWKRFEIEIPLISVKPNLRTKTLEFNGSTVIVYIRDQTLRYIGDQEVIEHLGPEDLRKFHIADCTTLRDMRRKGKYDERYVVTNRTHGKFTVNFLEGYGRRLIREGIECQLHVCKNCLSLLNYQDYSSSGRKDEIRDTFDRKEFLDKYASQITATPKYSVGTAPRNTYTEDWEQVSLRFREKAGWKCSKCQDYLGEDSKKRFLHVHHINGLKYNNSDDNLQVLCIMCHADIDDQLKHSPDYAKYQEIRQFREPV